MTSCCAGGANSVEHEAKLTEASEKIPLRCPIVTDSIGDVANATGGLYATMLSALEPKLFEQRSLTKSDIAQALAGGEFLRSPNLSNRMQVLMPRPKTVPGGMRLVNELQDEIIISPFTLAQMQLSKKQPSPVIEASPRIRFWLFIRDISPIPLLLKEHNLPSHRKSAVLQSIYWKKSVCPMCPTMNF